MSLFHEDFSGFFPWTIFEDAGLTPPGTLSTIAKIIGVDLSDYVKLYWYSKSLDWNCSIDYTLTSGITVNTGTIIGSGTCLIETARTTARTTGALPSERTTSPILEGISPLPINTGSLIMEGTTSGVEVTPNIPPNPPTSIPYNSNQPLNPQYFYGDFTPVAPFPFNICPVTFDGSNYISRVISLLQLFGVFTESLLTTDTDTSTGNYLTDAKLRFQIDGSDFAVIPYYGKFFPTQTTAASGDFIINFNQWYS